MFNPSPRRCPSPNVVPSSSLSPQLLFMLALFFICLSQQRMANAFLLTHRNLLLPFASSKGAAGIIGSSENNNKEDGAEIAFNVEEKIVKKKSKTQMQLLGFMAIPKSAIQSLRQQIEANGNDDGIEEVQQPRERRKRMHHLSILRKVGTQNWQIIGSRLFGPQKHTRELKRTVPLFLVEYD